MRVKRNSDNKEFRFGHLLIHMIRHNGFFEGQSEYRVDPHAVVEFFKIQPGVDYTIKYEERTIWRVVARLSGRYPILDKKEWNVLDTTTISTVAQFSRADIVLSSARNLSGVDIETLRRKHEAGLEKYKSKDYSSVFMHAINFDEKDVNVDIEILGVSLKCDLPPGLTTFKLVCITAVKEFCPDIGKSE